MNNAISKTNNNNNSQSDFLTREMQCSLNDRKNGVKPESQKAKKQLLIDKIVCSDSKKRRTRNNY